MAPSDSPQPTTMDEPATTTKDGPETINYPTGFAFIAITVALCLNIFLILLVSAHNLERATVSDDAAGWLHCLDSRSESDQRVPLT